MRALTVVPGSSGSGALSEVPEPAASDGSLLVETLAVGVCGTDADILRGTYGESAPGEPYLILGHESLGRVLEAPPGSGFHPGDHVVGIVRRPDPVPCVACARSEWDMCRNGLYTERGIRGRHGFGAERFRLEPAFAVAVDRELGETAVLLEPASVVAKAWDHIDRIGARAVWLPRKAVVTGAGPVGLLGALLAAQRGLEVHVLDRVAGGVKPDLVRALGAAYHTGDLASAAGKDTDVILECTGSPRIVMDALCRTSPGGILCLAGLSSGSFKIAIDAARLNEEMVLENDVVVGVVNANRRHYEAAGAALRAAPRGWLDRLLTHRVPLTEWKRAFEVPVQERVKAIILPQTV